jgi:high affinity sulfate transporter 1
MVSARNQDRWTWLPVISWLGSYSRAFLRADLFAGMTASAVVLPKAMACADIAGLPIETGLYTALAAMLVYPVFGTSRLLSVTSTSTLALMTAAEVTATNQGGVPAVGAVTIGVTLAFLVGVFMIAARILRLGFIANFISKPVLVGFEAGIGIVIIVSQLKSLLGVHLSSTSTVGILRDLPGTLAQTHLLTLALALSGIALLVLLPRKWPSFPASLLLVGLGVTAAAMFNLGAFGVRLTGNFPEGLPPFALPDFSLISRLWPAALGIVLMSFTESVSAARSFQQHEDPAINPDQELVAIGAANIAVSFFGGFPAGGGTSQTAVNCSAGARSQIAQWVSSGVVVACLLLFSKVLALIPQVFLGALVLVVAVSMIKPEKFRAIGRIRRDELWWAVVTMAGVVLIGTLEGILIAVAISVLTLFYQSNHPPVYVVAYNPEKKIFRRFGEDTDDVIYPGLLILRTEGRLTFANASYVGDRMRALMKEHDFRVIILECSAIPDIEYTALVMLTEARENLEKRGVELWLSTLNPDLFRMIERSPLGEKLGHDRMFFNLQIALEAYRAKGSAKA